MADVVGINAARAEKRRDNRLWSGKEMLQAMIGDVRDTDSVVAISLDLRDDAYGVAWKAASLSSSEMLALLEFTKHLIMANMGGGDGK